MAFNKVFVLLVWIIFGSGSLVYTVLADEYERMLIFEEPISNKALKGHVIRSKIVPDDGSCRLKCFLEPNCVSVNLGPQDKGNRLCELNSATEESASMEEIQGYTYYGVENPCHSNPCCGIFRHTVCQVGFTNKGFRCVNREGWKEKQCDSQQTKDLGMESGEISDAQIDASSKWDANHTAERGRLNFQETGVKAGAWSALINDVNQWLQIDMIGPYVTVMRVATQGRNAHLPGQWVTKYRLRYSDDGVNFRYYKQSHTIDKIFDGNTDQDTVVYHELNPPITARFIRFRPVAWHNHISMRVELYGCRELFQCPNTWIAFDGACYKLFTDEKDWNSANAFCNTEGAQLVKIETADEHDFIKKVFLIGKVDYWIGLTDAENENDWQWSDGCELTGYTNWRPGQPNGYNRTLCYDKNRKLQWLR
ncbi:uncharacterized protein LOC144658198 [Oculina patagonica]